MTFSPGQTLGTLVTANEGVDHERARQKARERRGGTRAPMVSVRETNNLMNFAENVSEEIQSSKSWAKTIEKPLLRNSDRIRASTKSKNLKELIRKKV